MRATAAIRPPLTPRRARPGARPARRRPGAASRARASAPSPVRLVRFPPRSASRPDASVASAIAPGPRARARVDAPRRSPRDARASASPGEGSAPSSAGSSSRAAPSGDPRRGGGDNPSGLLRFFGADADVRAPLCAFGGAVLLNVLLGTLYCWSCYLVPLERALGVGRAVLSVVFSLATVAFTVAVAKIGPFLYSRLSPAVIASGAALFGGLGMLIASRALPHVSVVPLFVGYALLFGASAGVGYGLSVQISDLPPFGEGLSTGLVTSARAAGAFVFAPVVRLLIDAGGVGNAMAFMGAALLAASVPVFVVFRRGGLASEPLSARRSRRSGSGSGSGSDPRKEATPEARARDAALAPALVTLWATLGLGVSAGLMVISHAAALLYTHGATPAVAAAGVSVVSAFTTLGRVAGGWACDAWGPGGDRGPGGGDRGPGGRAAALPREAALLPSASGAQRVLKLAPLLAIPFLCVGAFFGSSVSAAHAALAAASLTYGVMASAVPVEVRRRVGPRDFARAYGNVYTAWGVAGLAAPLAAGVLYDAGGTYEKALFVAVGLSALSAACASRLKPGRSHEEWAETLAGAEKEKEKEKEKEGAERAERAERAAGGRRRAGGEGGGGGGGRGATAEGPNEGGGYAA